MQSIRFGGEEHECVEIVVLGYERGPTGDYHDDNWLAVSVNICAGAFRGAYSAAFLTGELADLREQLVELHQTLKGKAEFTTLESQLSLTLTSDSLGQIRLTGEASDQPGTGNVLAFGLSFDQTYLQSVVRSLGEALVAFPVRA